MIAAAVLAAHVELNPGNWFAWIVVGLISGAIAARVVAGRGFGCVADIVVGIAGAIIGGFLLSSLFGASGNVGFWGSIIVAFIGAAALLAVLKLVSGGRVSADWPPRASARGDLCGLFGPRCGGRRISRLALYEERCRGGEGEEGDGQDERGLHGVDVTRDEHVVRERRELVGDGGWQVGGQLRAVLPRTDLKPVRPD